MTSVVIVAAGAATVAAQTFPTTGPAGDVVNLVCIGDSITESKTVPDRDHNGAPAVLARTLADGLGHGATVYLANAGASGTTTANWSGNKGLLVHGSRSAEAMASRLITAHPQGRLVFSIMLGTNDSANHGPTGAPVAPERYEKAMTAIIAELITAHPDCLIFLHHPTWYSTNTHNTSDYEGDSARDRLRSYFPVLDALVAADAKQPTRHVYLGDTQAYDHFAQDYLTELIPQQGKSGTFYLHPNAAGAASLGRYWATPILAVLNGGK